MTTIEKKLLTAAAATVVVLDLAWAAIDASYGAAISACLGFTPGSSMTSSWAGEFAIGIGHGLVIIFATIVFGGIALLAYCDMPKWAQTLTRYALVADFSCAALLTGLGRSPFAFGPAHYSAAGIHIAGQALRLFLTFIYTFGTGIVVMAAFAVAICCLLGMLALIACWLFNGIEMALDALCRSRCHRHENTARDR